MPRKRSGRGRSKKDEGDGDGAEADDKEESSATAVAAAASGGGAGRRTSSRCRSSPVRLGSTSDAAGAAPRRGRGQAAQPAMRSTRKREESMDTSAVPAGDREATPSGRKGGRNKKGRKPAPPVAACSSPKRGRRQRKLSGGGGCGSSSSSEDDHEEETSNRKEKRRRTNSMRAAARKPVSYVDESPASSSEDDGEEDKDELGGSHGESVVSTDSEEGEKPAVAKKRKREGQTGSSVASGGSSKKLKGKKGSCGNGNSKENAEEGDSICPHCGKKFTVSAGLQYHVKNFVCRQELRPGGPVPKGRQKVSASPGGSTSKKRKFKKERGALVDRTCPNCKRVFTSVLGCQYHVEKRVCHQDGTKGKPSVLVPCAAAQAGQEFITPIGVVRVIRDDRDDDAPSDGDDDAPGFSKAEVRKITIAWKKSVKKCENQARKFRTHATAMHLARRKKLGELHEEGTVNQKTVFEAYFRRETDPRHIDPSDYPAVTLVPPIPPDPFLPESAKPDRIVECVMIPDRREHHYVGPDSPVDALDGKNGSRREDGGDDDDDHEVCEGSATSARLYLPRRLLTEPYTQNATIYHCAVCGRTFTTKPGIKYHFQTKTCSDLPAKRNDGSKRRLDGIEELAVRLLQDLKPANSAAAGTSSNLEAATDNITSEGPTATSKRAREERSATTKKPHHAKKKRDKSVNALSVYPQVWLALKYKLLPRKEKKTKEGTVSAYRKNPTKKEDGNTDAGSCVAVVTGKEVSVVTSEPDTATSRELTRERADTKPSYTEKATIDDDHPDVVLRELRYQFYMEQGKSIGPMYPNVFRALRYKIPAEKRKNEEEMIRKKRRRAKRKKAAEEAPPKRLVFPPIVDMAVLVAEIDAGRYRSMGRYDGENRDTFCWICKKGADGEGECADSAGSRRKKVRRPALLSCVFCRRVVHFPCMRKVFTVKDLEPNDDLLCSHCIQCVQARRNRAEKRRTGGYGQPNAATAVQGRDKDATAVASSSSTEAKTLDLPNYGAVEEEHDEVAEQARRVSDLVDVLRDSRRRLSDCVQASKINSVRLSMIDADG